MDREKVSQMLRDRLTPMEMAAESGCNYKTLMARISKMKPPELPEWREAMIVIAQDLMAEGATIWNASEYLGVSRNALINWMWEAGVMDEPESADENDTVYSAPLEGFDPELEQLLRREWV